MQVKTKNEMTAVVSKITELLDPGSFVELGEHVAVKYSEFYQPDSVVESDGVVTGYGTINGNLIFIYAQDAEVMGGTFGEAHGRKIVELYKHAIKAKAPVIGLLDCAGFRIEEGMGGLHQFSKLYNKQAKAWNQIPQIMAVIGQCGGGMSIAAELSDFVFIEEGKGSIFVNPQGVVSNAIGNNPFVTAVDDGKYPWDEIIEKIRKLIELLPSSSDFRPEIQEVDFDTLNRDCPEIKGMLGDARAIIKELSDDYDFIESVPDVGQDMITGLMTIAGETVGVIACNTVEGEKRITSQGCDKATALVETCGKFNIPILTIIDTEGYQTTSENEKNLPNSAARMLIALAGADVPKINLITGSVVGSTYSLLNPKGLGADYVFMWDSAEASIVNARQATEVIYSKWSKELEDHYRETQSSAVALARNGLADKVIAPEDSRKYLIGALQTFVNSR